MPLELLKIGLIEPNTERFSFLLGLLPQYGAEVSLQATNTKFALQSIGDTKVADLAGAFIGNVGGSLREMQSVVNVLRDKYPQSYLIAVVQSAKFKFSNHDYKIQYDELNRSTLDFLMNNIKRRHIDNLKNMTD